MVNNKCKIGDFGFATTISSGDLDDSCGTPCYISPQIENSERYTYKADCWSLGVLAYELINGKLA
jgi:serine/threonine protein kinase